MKCEKCQKDVRIFNTNSYCEECITKFLKYSLFEGIVSWAESLSKADLLFFKSEIYLIEKYKGRKYSTDNISNLLEDIKDIIKNHLSFYTKEDLIAAILMHRQFFRAAIDLKVEDYWEWMNEFSIANLLIELIFEIDNNDFYGASIGELDEGYCNLVTAISLSRILLNISSVLDVIFKDGEEKLEVSEILKRQNQDEVFGEYFENLKADPSIVKPEQYRIENENLILKLKEENLDFFTLEGKVEDFFKTKYQITPDEMRSLTDLSFRLENLFESYAFKAQSFKLIIINRDRFYEIVKNEFGLERSKFEKIISIFSLPDLNELKDVDKNINYELKSILVVNDLIIFGPYDLMQNGGVFEALHHSSHFPYLFIEEYQKDMNLMNKEMDGITKHMTSYFVASVVDILIQGGYRIPFEKKRYSGEIVYVPRFEIDKIISNGTNILSNKGDIDVLALDETNKIIFNIEVKYYQPATSLKEMMVKDTKKLTSKKTTEKIKNRQEALILHKNEVLDLFNIKGGDEQYKVKSLIVTARENFYLTSNNYPYYNWIEFNKAVRANKL
ncbi:hypothetical protein ACTFSO_18920 [Bacillus cereus group sp. MYBK120-1]|uniref:hypothetical protein n=1 Tax=Bacillus cereus group TaxID=86661 RepID=UPI00234D6E72|nr:hypothetical protein [Bacillus cereus]MDC7729665.1 hypothetical protein [Bacillus cereus]